MIDTPGESDEPEGSAVPGAVPLRVLLGRHDGRRAVFHGDPHGKGPLFRGRGETNFVCGHCGSLLAERVRADDLTGILLTCYHCGSYNERNLA